MTQITDEAVQAAMDAWSADFPIPTRNEIIEMLTAAIPHLQLGYEVKKLDWRKSSAGKLTAKTPIMEYQIFNEEGFWAIKYDGVHLFCNIYVTRDEAKAAAQADFEHRVRECIVPVNITKSSGCVFKDLGIAKPVDVAVVRRQVLEEVEHAIGSTVLQHQVSDYEGMNSLEAYEAGQINGLECAQSSLVALSADLTKEVGR